MIHFPEDKKEISIYLSLDKDFIAQYPDYDIYMYIFFLLHKETLRKHAYSNILKILSPKIEIFQLKNSNSFHVSAQNIDCGYSLEPPRRGGSNMYSQSVF